MRLSLSILSTIICFSAYAQTSDFGNWLMYLGNKKINDKFNWHHEVQYRNYDAIGDMEQLLLRTGVGYNITENNNNVLLGYGYVLSQVYNANTDVKTDIGEHFIFQQFITKQSIGRVGLQHRYRIEERFAKGNYNNTRFRYFLSLNIPINHKNMEDKTAYFSTYNEIFLLAKQNAYDRNRLYGGLGYKLNKNLRIEVGYMNQFFTNTNRDQLNIITFVSF